MKLNSNGYCINCDLHLYRKNIVPGRGVKPADLLFIGEAPGRSEDLRAKAFIGPSGRLLKQAFEKAVNILGIDEAPTYYITNVVQCRPTNSRLGKNREPTEEEAWACWPNLEKTYLSVKPVRVIFIGKVAVRFCKEAWPGADRLIHPAYIIRQGGIESTEFTAFVRDLSQIFKEVIDAKA